MYSKNQEIAKESFPDDGSHRWFARCLVYRSSITVDTLTNSGDSRCIWPPIYLCTYLKNVSCIILCAPPRKNPRSYSSFASHGSENKVLSRWPLLTCETLSHPTLPPYSGSHPTISPSQQTFPSQTSPNSAFTSLMPLIFQACNEISLPQGKASPICQMRPGLPAISSHSTL